MSKSHHLRTNYITIIKMICRETDTPIAKDLEKKSDYQLLYYMNLLLAKNNCIPLVESELEFDLQ